MLQVEFFYDFSSPYSYLASTQIEGLEARTGAAVIWRPFALGHVFKETGNRMNSAVPAKGKYMIRDVQRWAEFYRIPLKWPTLFPIKSTPALRAALAAEAEGKLVALSHAFFNAYWAEGQDPTQPETIKALAEKLGLPAETILARSEAEDIREKLKADTNDAIQRGAFGAPTFFVGEEMFWGNDRMEMVERHLRTVGSRQ
jgi:2-hydroxychromene-2-carboxylate isomerase